MTEQPGNPTDPTQPDPAASSDAGAAPTPPPAAPTPPPAAPATPPAQSPAAPATGRSQYDFNQARSTLEGAHKFDLGIMAAGLVAFLAGFLPFYTASASFAGHSVSASWSAWHGFFGWFGVLLALVGAVLVALTLFSNVALPVPVYQAAVGAFGLALLCLILALFITPGGNSCSGASAFGVGCNTGRGFGYWLALILVLAGLALSVLRMRESTTTTGSTTA
jgi:hypothetical protein